MSRVEGMLLVIREDFQTWYLVEFACPTLCVMPTQVAVSQDLSDASCAVTSTKKAFNSSCGSKINVVCDSESQSFRHAHFPACIL